MKIDQTPARCNRCYQAVRFDYPNGRWVHVKKVRCDAEQIKVHWPNGVKR